MSSFFSFHFFMIFFLRIEYIIKEDNLKKRKQVMFRENTNFAAIVPNGIIEILKEDRAFKNPKLLENALLFITHLKLHNQIYKDTEERNPAIGYHSDLLRAIFSSDYFISLVNRLIELCIVEKTGYYSPGSRSYQYKLSDKYFFEKSTIYRYKYKGVVKKIVKIKNKFYKNNYLKLDPHLQSQYDNLQCMFIDKEEADKWIDEQFPIWNEENSKLSSDKQKNIILRKNYYHDSVNKIHYGFLHNISVSHSNLRLNSVITAFPKLLRKFLYIQDALTGIEINKSIEIDGSNTQPLMLCLYLEKFGYSIETEIKELCSNGLLYDTIATELNETRSWVKERMMDTLLFTRTNGSYTYKFKICKSLYEDIRKFSKHCLNRFPLFFKALLNEKQKLETVENNSQNWINPGGSELAKRIQMMESEIWIHTVLKELPENLFYATIHDSIMVFDPTIEDIIITRNKIIEVGYRLHGIHLPLKLEFHNIEEQEKEQYLEAFKHDIKQELNKEYSEKKLNSTCLRKFKIDDLDVQDEQEHVITEVSLDLLEKLYRNENGVYVKRANPNEIV